MKTGTGNYKILWYQGGGFLLILVFNWISAILIPDRFERPGVNWAELLIESLVIVGVGIPVMLVVHRLLSRLHYLEGFLRVCAWCRKVESHEEWVPIEELFREEFQLESSHGICPECYAVAEAKRREAQPAKPDGD